MLCFDVGSLIIQLFEWLMIDTKVRQGAPQPYSHYQSSWSHSIMSQHGTHLIIVQPAVRSRLRVDANSLYLLRVCHLFERDACGGRLYNFIWMGTHKLESPEGRRVITFLIGDSFLRSWNVHRDVAGDTFARRRHLKWLNRKVCPCVNVVPKVCLYFLLVFYFKTKK